MSAHGGKRVGAGRKPKRKRSRTPKQWRMHKNPTSESRKGQMRERNKDEKISQLKLEKEENAIAHTVAMKDATDTIDDLYEINGKILSIEQMDDCMMKDSLFDDVDHLQRGLFDLYLEYIFNTNTPITKVDEAMDATFDFMIHSTKCSKDNAEKLKKLKWSKSKCVKWVAGKLLPFVYYILSILILIAVPEEGCVVLYDGTKRENKDYEGIGLAFNDIMNENINISRKWKWGSTEKESRANAKKVNLKSTSNVSRLLVGYERNYGKDAKATKYTIAQNMNDIRTYLNVLEDPDNKKVIIDDFGEDNVNFKEITERVEAQQTDRHIVVVNKAVFNELREVFANLLYQISCLKHDVSNAILAINKLFKRLRVIFKELDELGHTINIATFAAKKFKESSLYPHQCSTTLLAAAQERYGDLAVALTKELLCSLDHCRGQRLLNRAKNADKYDIYILNLQN